MSKTPQSSLDRKKKVDGNNLKWRMTQSGSHRQILSYTKALSFLSLSTCQGEGTLAILEEIVSTSVNKTGCSFRALRGASQIM